MVIRSRKKNNRTNKFKTKRGGNWFLNILGRKEKKNWQRIRYELYKKTYKR